MRYLSALVLFASLAIPNGLLAKTKVEQKFPGMVLEEGQTMADLGKGARVSQPAPKALQALESDDVLGIEVGDWIVMRPKEGTTIGLIFYHGAETDPRGYARPLRAIAERGYLVVAVTMPRYLAIMEPYKADEVLRQYPEITSWAIGGHSMGGAMAAQYVHKKPGLMAGLLLWDAYPPSNVDLRETGSKVAQIYRTDAEGNAPENFREVDYLLPDISMRFPMQGADHTYFGDFILASHRPEPEAQITLDEQLAIVIDGSLSLMKAMQE